MGLSKRGHCNIYVAKPPRARSAWGACPTPVAKPGNRQPPRWPDCGDALTRGKSARVAEIRMP
eukprot:4330937-Lingulodinium_polyedra.AAC.1